ncbi:MAG: serine hydrolase domain-containing protein [Hyphomonadaceae bacterium]
MPATSAAFDDLVKTRNLKGAYMIVRRGEKTLFERQAGDLTRDSVIPIASASKWIGGTVLMTAVQDASLSLHSRAGAFFPDLPQDKASMTLAQMFSHTAGMIAIDKPYDLNLDPYEGGDLRSAARKALDQFDLVAPPGTSFGYGGTSMLVAGAIVEDATRASWPDLFKTRIASPLGMTSSFWFSPMPAFRYQPGRTVTLPNIQAGVHTSPADYLRFLTMIDFKGQSPGGPRILKIDAIEAMERSQTTGLGRFFVPPGVKQDWNYAVGFWCEKTAADGRCTLMSSPGAYGFYPWVNRENGTYGLFAVVDRLPNVADGIRALRKTAETELAISPRSDP